MVRKIDLSGIKDNDLDKTSSFTDLMTRKERKSRLKDDFEEMIEEKRRNTNDLTKELEKAKKQYEDNTEEDKEEKIGRTQILELTRQMKFNFEENKKENEEKKKKGISTLNIVGEVNLLCIGYYIYLLVFTNYQDSEKNYLITGSIIVLLVLLFGLSVITNKKVSKFFNILNILAIISFIAFNVYSLLY